MVFGSEASELRATGPAIAALMKLNASKAGRSVDTPELTLTPLCN